MTSQALFRLVTSLGDDLYSNRRHQMLTLVADTSPSLHDMSLRKLKIQQLIL